MSNFIPIEPHLYARGYSIIAGIDEAGRGPLAGPVVSAAVILKKDTIIEGLNDSKKLTAKASELDPSLGKSGPPVPQAWFSSLYLVP